jgi:hypothetical protein
VYLRALTAAIAVVAVPIAVQGAEAPRRTPATPADTKRVCQVTVPMGSRLGGVRRCRSRQEHDAHKAEARDVVDRVQRMKPTMCPPNC